MRDLIRREPRDEMERYRSGFDQFLSDAFFRNMPFGGQGVFPAVDLRDTENALIANVDLPGIDINDVEVSTNNDTLTISGEVKTRNESDDGEMVWQERSMGRFYRSFKLPATIKSDEVDASYKEGVLKIEMPKSDELKSRTIKVKQED